MARVILFLAMLTMVGCTNTINTPVEPMNNNPSGPINAPADPPIVQENNSSASANDLPEPTPPADPADTPAKDPRELHGLRFRVETVASGLNVPWAMAWLDDGRLIFTQRGGDLSIVEADGTIRRLHHFDEVQEQGDGGLMGLAVSPTFSRDGLIYVSYTGQVGQEPRNIIARVQLTKNVEGGEPVVAPARVVLNAMPAGKIHNGLPLRFGPDGMLWAFTGDAGLGDRARRRTELAGKLLRLTLAGQVPNGNPFPNSLVWTQGHRHVLGFDWHPVTGKLYATEQGPLAGRSGPNSRGNELNHIYKNSWYDQEEPGGAKTYLPVDPIHTWKEPVAPAGAVFYRGDAFPAWRNRLFVTMLDGQAVHCVTISDDDPDAVTDVSALLHKEFGRLRAIAVGPDGYLYITTSNKDGSGNPTNEDDRIIRLVPE